MTIHCCWFGEEPKDALSRRCRESWARFAPSCDVREWTREALADAPAFVQAALKAKKWAFAADWLRFKALFACGGLYLDYDVELFAPLTDFGANWVAGQASVSGGTVPEPAVLALEKGSPLARAMLDYYATATFDASQTVSDVMRRLGLVTQLKVLPAEVFCPIGLDGRMTRTAQTVGVHHCAMRWAGWRRRLARWMNWHGLRPLVNALLNLRRCGA